MKVQAALINDPLPLTLGAKVGAKPVAAAPVDIDLTVKWVGDVLDPKVQVSDMQASSLWSEPVHSEQLDAHLWGSSTVSGAEYRAEQRARNDAAAAALETIAARCRAISAREALTMPRIGVDFGAGDTMVITRAAFDKASGEVTLEQIDPRGMYRDPDRKLSLSEDYAIEGRGGYTREQYLAHMTGLELARKSTMAKAPDTATGMRMLQEAAMRRCQHVDLPNYLCTCEHCVANRRLRYGA